MTPKEKAQELVAKYRQITITTYGCGMPGNTCIVSNSMLEKSAIRCAIIAVDELMISMAVQQSNEDFYWEKVKNELNKML
jgi:hypothetical protein